MSNLYPVAIEGHIVPGVRDPTLAFSFVTETPHGEPMRIPEAAPPADQKPKDLGQERHLQLLSAIKGMGGGGVKIDQGAQQTAYTEAMPGNRDWRN